MKKRNKAFTLAEMMVVMLILTVMLAAFAPLMTKRKAGSASESPWRYAVNNTDAYFGIGDNQTAMLGQKSKNAGENARLIINTKDNQRHILFKKNGTQVADLWFNGNNFLFGTSFASAHTVDYWNTAFGSNAMKSTTDGGLNTAFGANALESSVDTDWNTALGAEALKALTSGGANTAVGNRAMYQVVEASNCDAFGSLALSQMESGSYNAAIGHMAMNSFKKGDYNTALGYHAFQGTSAEASYNTAAGALSLENTTTGSYNVALGYNALQANTTGSNNVAVGANALATNTTGSNTAVGTDALTNATGTNNTAVGFGALKSLTSGTNNVAIGNGAALNMTGGTNNVAIGTSILKNNTSGSRNIAIGSNVSVNNTTGTDNIGFGNMALFANKTGKYNIALGSQALYNLTGKEVSNDDAKGVCYLTLTAEAQKNTCAKNYEYSDYTTVQCDNELMVRNNGHCAYYADWHLTTPATTSSLGDKNVAIGYKACSNVTGSNKTCIGSGSGPTSKTATHAADGEDVVYIGNANSKVYIPGYLYVANRIFSPEDIYQQTSFSEFSDKRLKNIQGENKSGLEKVRELKVFDFTFKNDDTKTPRVGVIAQDLKKVFPAAVTKDDNGFLKIRMEDMFYAVVNAVKQLDTLVQNLIQEIKNIRIQFNIHDSEIKKLKQENIELRERLEKLERKVL